MTVWQRIAAALTLSLALAAPALASDSFILTAPESEVPGIAARNGLVVMDRVPERDVFLVRGPNGVAPATVIARVLADPELDDEADKVFMELDAIVQLPEAGLARPLHATTVDAERALGNTRLVTFHGSRVWASYARQRATTKVRVAEAHAAYGAGAGIVAVIDAGVDPTHPALAGALVGGFDFTRDLPEVSELADIDAVHPILNPDNVVILDNTSVVRLNPSTQVLVEAAQASALASGVLPETFGHGTMVASVVRLVAPGAQIMPLKAFGADGRGRLWNVVRALYHAQQAGAHVVNLSLGLPTPSKALGDAVSYLHEKQMFCVASVGNDGRNTLRYPAAFPEALGVASVRPNDRRSAFSNFGAALVTLSAPGEALVVAYPAGQYALAWGTSFSAPLASGALALMLEVKSGINWDEVRRAFAQAAPVVDAGMGAGRLDVMRAVGDAAGFVP